MWNKNQPCFTIWKEKSTTMCYSRTDYIFQNYLCKNTAELWQDENIKRVSVSETYVDYDGPFCENCLKLLAVYYFCKNISTVSDVW